VFVKAWYRWLRVKYSSEDSLRAAWNDATVTFDTITPPTYDERLHATLNFFRDPAREQKTIDYHEYINVAVAEALESFAGFSNANPESWLSGFYGFIFEHATVPGACNKVATWLWVICLSAQRLTPSADRCRIVRSRYETACRSDRAFMTTVDSIALMARCGTTK
jgi:hypothetical protein